MTTISAIEAIVVNVSPKTNWTFIAITTDAGVTGWGECSLNRWEPLLTAYAEILAIDFIGADPAKAVDRIRHLAHSPGGLIAHAVSSAYEQAITDLRAQLAEQAINQYVGRTRRSSVPAYANINRGVKSRSPEGFAAAAREATGAGYTRVKLAPFDGVIAEDAGSTPIDARIREGLDRVFAVRDAIGPATALLVDCHWRFDDSSAASLISDLARAAPYWIECPISEHPSRFASIARLRQNANARGIKLAGGEMISAPGEALTMCESSLYDVLMPDVKYAGGYRGMLAIAGICHEHGVAFSPHNPTGPIAHLASIHACAMAPSVLWLEHQWAESPLFDLLVGGCAAQLVDAAFVVPRGPGLGAALDVDVARAYPYRSLPRDANLDERLG